MSPSTLRIPVLAGLLVLLSACGEPPQVLPTAPPYVPASAPSVAPALTTPPPATIATLPPLPTATLAPPAYPTPTTTAPTTTSPTPTPSHAPACVGEPTGTQILTLVKAQKKGVPTEPLKVDKGPFCSGDWSFTTVEIVGKDEDQLEPLMVLATGKGVTLTFVAAGSDVCSNRVQTTAPAGIRVLACGF